MQAITTRALAASAALGLMHVAATAQPAPPASAAQAQPPPALQPER